VGGLHALRSVAAAVQLTPAPLWPHTGRNAKELSVLLLEGQGAPFSTLRVEHANYLVRASEPGREGGGALRKPSRSSSQRLGEGMHPASQHFPAPGAATGLLLPPPLQGREFQRAEFSLVTGDLYVQD